MKRDPKIIAFWAFMAVALVAGVGMFAAVSMRTAPAAESVPYTSSAVAASDVSVDLSKVDKAIFIGDSWTYGANSEPATDGFAYRTGKLLGIQTEVHGWGGVGYVNTGVDGAGNFQQRWSKIQPEFTPDLVVVEGSLNDTKSTPIEVRDNAKAFLSALQSQFPNAQILVLGPSAASAPWIPEMRNFNYELKNVTADLGIAFIDPMAWLTNENYAEFVDPASPHLNTAGHEYYANQLVATLREAATN